MNAQKTYPSFIASIIWIIWWIIYFFTALGAAYGTAKSGTGIAAMSVMRPELIMKSIIPVVMAGIVAIYGLIVAILIAGQLTYPADYPLYRWADLTKNLSISSRLTN